MYYDYSRQLLRVGAALSAMAALIITQKEFAAEADIKTMTSIGVAFIIWISTEILETKNIKTRNAKLHDSDIAKINRITKFINKNQFYKLKYKCIETYIDEDDYRGISNLLQFRETDIFPFYNKKIQGIYDDFCKGAEDFLNDLWGIYTYSGNGMATWRSRHCPYLPEDEYHELQREIQRIEQNKTKITEKWESLIQTAKSQLKGDKEKLTEYD